jgi:colicin import membrane protein
MAAITALRQCAYPGCDHPPTAPGSDRGAKPKYCADPNHNPLSAHRERRRRDADASGQRAAESGGQPVTLGINRAAELVSALEKLTAQHADILARAITELRAVGDIESAEAEVYVARTNADQRVATAEARLGEEIQRRRDAEAERDAARADREQADAAAISRAEHAQAAAADETARIRADHQHALDQLTTATSARITDLEETRDALRTRAERAEGDLDAARTENQRLAEQLAQAASPEGDPAPAEVSPPLPRKASRAKRTPATARGTTARSAKEDE